MTVALNSNMSPHFGLIVHFTILALHVDCPNFGPCHRPPLEAHMA